VWQNEAENTPPDKKRQTEEMNNNGVEAFSWKDYQTFGCDFL
jgi:hypothetical protein